MKTPVAIVHCAAYKPEELEAAVASAVEIASGLNVEGKRVLLKPNILRDAPPERALSTHPEFVRAVLRYVKKAGAARILVGDSPGVHRADFQGRGCGIRQVVEEEGAEWANFRGGKLEFKVDKPLIESSFGLTDALKNIDVIISLPKLKTHEFMYYTGAIKNLYGLIPGYTKAALHVKYSARDDFGKMLVDLVQAVGNNYSCYSIMDAVVAMEGPGPGNGFPRSTGIVAASSSLTAMDLAFSALIGYEPDSVPTNRYALGVLDGIESFDDYELKGMDFADAQPEQFELIGGSKRGPVARFMMRFGFFRRLEIKSRPLPQFDHEKCIGCGECIAICASRALSFASSERYVQIDTSKCIRCYCCHEICPVEAITIQK